MPSNVKLTRITTLEKSAQGFNRALPHRAIKESSYVTEDFRFIVYKIDNTLWSWGTLETKEEYVNNISNLNHHANTKEGVVRNLELYIAEEKADYKNWTA